VDKCAVVGLPLSKGCSHARLFCCLPIAHFRHMLLTVGIPDVTVGEKYLKGLCHGRA